MKHTPGTRLGPYEVIAPVGAGGMGEVYRARDTRLNRDVAIKVLPEMFALDAERIARFEREAQVLASLNHPHIAQVHGVIDAPPALVMEFVGGEDLAQRLVRGPIPVREALALAAQVAEALAAAHDRGIVHRDLKPANVKVTDDGVVKVLDFGLAKALETPSASGAALMDSPTITSPAAMTRMGVILGTAAYMSPEQAKGKAVDRSADLWAFGALLYEMLTGTAAFAGETVTDVLAAIVMRDPDWSALPSDTPPGVARLLRRCLNRDRRGRLADAGEARFQIDEALAAPAGGTNVGDSSRRPSRVMTLGPWGVAAVLALALVALAWSRPSAPDLGMTHLSIEMPQRALLSTVLRPAIAISRDGKSVAFVATLNGVDRLFVRTGDRFEARMLERTEGASNPDISPDGRWVAFISGNQLYKMPIGGGPRIELAAVNDPRGVRWDVDDAILVTPRVGGVARVPSGGGPLQIVSTPVEGQERTHRWASTLPGGKAIIFTVGDFNNPDSYVGARIDALVLATGERKTLIPAAEMARYSPSGHLVFARAGALFAVAFDPDTLTVGDVTEAVLQGVSGDTTTGAAHFDISASGTLAYIPAGAEQAPTRLAWVDKTGRVDLLGVPPGAYADPAVSPEGKRIAITVIAGGGRDIWIFHADRGTFTPMTFGGMSFTPAWSRDGRWIYYATLDPSDASGSIWRRVADGSREAEPLVTLGHRFFLNAISADGLTALFDYSHAGTGGSSDIGVISLQTDAKARPFVAGRADEFAAKISPDGRWVAYESSESSRPEIYVRPADMSSSGRWQVSAAGGREPKWSRDGRALYFRYGSEMFTAPIDPGPAFQNGPPVRVLADVYDPRNETGMVYDVHPDGRFLTIRPADEQASTNAIRLNLSWFEELRKIGAR